MYSVLLTLAIAVVSCGVVVRGETAEAPRCDPNIVGDLDKYYPNGIPKNMLGSMLRDGPYSYISLSSPNALVINYETATCVGFRLLKDKKTVIVTKKMNTGELPVTYRVHESEGVISYESPTDIEPKHKVYFLAFGDGVAVTYRCCDSCSGSSLNVGIAVADRLKDTAETQAAIKQAEKMLNKYNLDDNTVDLRYCSTIP
uniref:Lipocalin/cytosolic fatty-acid binding domain-containing protein n=1 Tax=Cuerna arida TaxID=1464854 RepID=A0A1B6F088_9HEMI